MSTPFVNEEFTFTNPDGSAVQVRGWGNQYHARFETLDGYTVVQDPDTGFYQYATLADDGHALVPTGHTAGEVDPQSLDLRPHLQLPPERARQQAQRSPLRQGAPSRWQIRRAEKKTRRRAMMPSAAGELPQAQGTITVGNFVGLCILIRFPDVADTIPVAAINSFCNQAGYTGYGNNGSVRDYFFDNSKGKLTYTNVVTQYYTAAHNRAYYTDPAIAYGTRAKELIVEALTWLKAQGFNFGQLTSDGSGYVNALNVFYAGPTVNNWSQGLWPHSWNLAAPFDAGGGKKMFDYQITDIGSELTLRTFCHENGHMVCDYPDLYDYDSGAGASAGLGHFCLMCYGGNDKNPVQICAYLKNESGWATKAVAIMPGITATLSAANNDFYIYAKSATEYMIMENRQKTGRDTFLPDAGLAIFHVDENGNNSNEQRTPAQHYECSLVQADNRFDLEKNANAGDADDLFGAPTRTEFSDTTNPSSKWWDGSNSGLRINAVSASGAVMTFNAPATINWENSKAVLSTYTSPHSMNAWAYVQDLGWRKVQPLTPDGVTNMFVLLAEAQAYNRKVNVYADTSLIYQAYCV
ncbi:M6 family metalloprotease domain-containing protein [Oxalobacteraceae bacterium OTU3CINTB1]|nr:M6 family metalloprotease domain-containing protein [Oxalobacteraceae bacterium OTU3CINTB1]